MTAETLKPFISLPGSKNSSSSSSTFLKKNFQLIGICSVLTLIVVFSSLIGYTIWNAIRISQLEKETDTLKTTLSNMQKRLGLDYLDEMEKFDDLYSKTIHSGFDKMYNGDDDNDDDDDDDDDDDALLDSYEYDDIEDDDHDDEEDIIVGNNKYNTKINRTNKNRKDKIHNNRENLNFGDEGEVEEEELDEVEEENENISGDYDDGNYDDDEENDDDVNVKDDNIYDDFDHRINKKERKPRSVSLNDSIDEDYHEGIAAMDDEEYVQFLMYMIYRLYADIALKWVYLSAELVKINNSTDLSSLDLPDEEEKLNISSRRKRDIGKRNQPEEEYQNNIEHNNQKKSYTLENQQNSYSNNRHSPLASRNVFSGQKRQVGLRSRSIAMHLVLNSTRPYYENHRYYSSLKDDNELFYDGDLYVGHSTIEPFTPLSGTRNVNQQNSNKDKIFYNENGIIRIKLSGIYFVYAQIYYHNYNLNNGFNIFHNIKPALQCVITTSASTGNNNELKANTCYTSGILHLKYDDIIYMRDLYKNHNVSLKDSKSFFGLIRLG